MSNGVEIAVGEGSDAKRVRVTRAALEGFAVNPAGASSADLLDLYKATIEAFAR